MAAWLPIVKTAIPIIAEIVTVARPMFTKNAPEGDRDPLTRKQIEELQAAATQNSQSVVQLAEQVEKTFEAMEAAALDLQKDLQRQRRLTLLALTVGLVGLALGLLGLSA